MGRHDRIAAMADVAAPPSGISGDSGGGAALEVAVMAAGRGLTVRALLTAAGAGAIRVHAVDETSDLDDDVLHDRRVRSVIADLSAALPFEDGTLDRVISFNVVEHLDDPPAHVLESYRVLRPGGLLVLGHSDWDTALFTSDDPFLTRALVDRFASAVPAWADRVDGFMGRKIVPLAAESSFDVVTIDTWADCHRRFDDGSVGWKVAMGLMAAAHDDEALYERATKWLASLRRLAEADRFLFAVTDVAAVLRKPVV